MSVLANLISYSVNKIFLYMKNLQHIKTKTKQKKKQFLSNIKFLMIDRHKAFMK